MSKEEETRWKEEETGEMASEKKIDPRATGFTSGFYQIGLAKIRKDLRIESTWATGGS